MFTWTVAAIKKTIDDNSNGAQRYRVSVVNFFASKIKLFGFVAAISVLGHNVGLYMAHVYC